MKTLIITIASALTILCSAATIATEQTASHDASWKLFCAARGYEISDTTDTAVNDYLDTWCGSAEEEKALLTEKQ